MRFQARRERTLRELRPFIHRAREFSGWSLNDVEVRSLEPGPPWNYVALARERAAAAAHLLDLGTGGGGVLTRVLDGLRVRAVATEEWDVNAPIAQRRLGQLGTPVVRCSSLRLPFADARFDLVLDRHEALDPAEVVRVLRPRGSVLTQQVGHDDWGELWPFFPERRAFDDHSVAYAEDFRALGMAVRLSRHARRIAFRTLGDLVYMLLLTPWLLPRFDPERQIDTLLAIEDALGTDDGIVVTERRYLLIADKPG